MDWAKITSQIEHASTLDDAQLSAFLESVKNTQEGEHIIRLLKSKQYAPGFLATSSPTKGLDERALESGTLLGAWKIKELIGQGGMGDVYRATRADGLYEQTVALKLIQNVSPLRAQLFEIERQRLAMMNHASIARIIDGGTSEDDRPFMAMEYIDGKTITEYAIEQSLTIAERLALFMSVCDAVEHAHSNLVLHRDIKSSNVIVGQDGLPRLIDFGIAIELDADFPVSGAMSLSTAAPEQLKGEAVSVQTDIFGLGVLLHELLSNERPVRLASGGMLVKKPFIASKGSANKDLEAIVNKAMALEPSRRYATVTALKEDLQSYLKTKVVQAREGGLAYIVGKFIQRHPISNALGLLVVISVISGLGISLMFAAEAKKEAERANMALLESQESLAKSQFFLERANVIHATQSAYADSLQAMFGNDADVNRQTKVLKDRWEQAHLLRKEDPNNAAYISFAIGRHFLFRNDYVTAIEILKPLTDEAYGPKPVVSFARQLLAIAYMSTGKEQEALPILRQTEQWFAADFDAFSPDHIASATQIAELSKADEDISRAETLLLKGLESEQSDPVYMYFYHQLSKMRQMAGDFEGAYQAMLQAVEHVESKPLMDISGTDTAYLNLAGFKLWYAKQAQQAEKLAKKVLQTAESKGQSRESGLAYSLLANIRFVDGKAEDALSYIESAIALSEKYSGEESKSSLWLYIQRAEIAASLGLIDPDLAINSLSQKVDKFGEKSNVVQRYNLAKVYISFTQHGLGAAQQAYDSSSIDRSLIARNIELKHLHDRLIENGINVQGR